MASRGGNTTDRTIATSGLARPSLAPQGGGSGSGSGSSGPGGVVKARQLVSSLAYFHYLPMYLVEVRRHLPGEQHTASQAVVMYGYLPTKLALWRIGHTTILCT